MGLALFAFISIFLLIASGGVLIFYRVGMLQRLSVAISPASDRESWLTRLKMRAAVSSFKKAVQPVAKILPKSSQEVSVVQKRLIRAGYREESAVRIFYATKVLVPLWLCVLTAVTGIAQHTSFFIYVVVLALGYLAPDFWVGHLIKKREMNIRIGLPEFLDLMVVCIEAGLSLDQALDRSAGELRASQPEISDELGLTLLENRAGCPRVDAWRHLAERVDIDIMRALVAALVQADQFGTSLAKTLRVYSDALRIQRRQYVEEMAAKTPVKLVFPLVLFIFPSLFVVTVGPAVIVMSESFSKYFK